VDFDFSQEQRQLKDEARRFLGARCSLSLVRATLGQEDAERHASRALYKEIAELGWCGTAIPEASGGLGLGYVELCAIAEELGRALAPVPFASSIYFFAEGVMAAGSAEQRARLLPRLARGEIVGCLAAAEGSGAHQHRGVRCQVRAGRLNGIKIPVIDGDAADLALVLAAEERGPSLFLADLTDPGVQRTALQSLDPSRGVARLSFSDVPVELVGGAGEGGALVERICNRAAVSIAFEQLGGADRSLELARDYALERRTFGRPIGSYQAIKHRLADMYVKNELARSIAYYAAWALASAATELPRAAAMARVAASDAFGFASRESIQIHGGVGVTWEASPHLFFRRAHHLSLVCGASDGWAERLAADLCESTSAPCIGTEIA
jgi:alkylation response protein AidB-like acyl-CoA dehydrogenase